MEITELLKHLIYFCIKKMERNIAFFHEYFPKGGAERVTLDICEYLITRGYNIFLFTREYYADKLPVNSLFNKKAKVLVLPDTANSNSSINAKFIANTSIELNIETLIIQAYVLRSIQEIKALDNKLKIIYCNHSMPFWEIDDKIARKKRNAKLSISRAIHYYLIDIHKIYTFKSYHNSIFKTYKKLYDEVDAYVTLCDSYSNQIKNELHLKDTKKLFSINNSVKPVERIVTDKQNIVLFMGRLSYADKRVDRLINIWNMLKGKTDDWKLIIVGEGSEKKNLESQVKRLNLTNVEFAGFSNNPQQYYAIASILCLTSSFEGWGLVLTEAQANGIVPIAFDCSEGVKSILSPDKINGLLIPPFDLEVYAKNLLFVMNDTETRKRIQKNVIEKSKSYSPEVIGEKWIELLDSIGHKS